MMPHRDEAGKPAPALSGDETFLLPAAYCNRPSASGAQETADVIETLRHDLALAARSLSRAPGFTLAVVLTLALGIGGTATMFTAVNAAYLQPLPYPDAGRVTLLWQTYKGRPHVSVSMLDALDWMARSRTYAHMAAFYDSPVNVTSGADPTRLPAGYITRDFFAAFGVSPRLGRSFSAEELLNNGPRAVVIGHGLWQRVFHGDPKILERTLAVEGVALPVIGVMPAGFSYPAKAELWLPTPIDDGSTRSAHNYSVVGRLKPGVSVEPAQADMSAVQAALDREYPARGRGRRRRGRASAARPPGCHPGRCCSCCWAPSPSSCSSPAPTWPTSFWPGPWRGAARPRCALPSERTGWRSSGPFVLESVLLSLLGGALGLGFAAGGSRFPRRPGSRPGARSGELPHRRRRPSLHLRGGPRRGVVCGLVPALRASRLDLRTALSSGGRGTTEGRRGMRALIAAEVAVAFVLLVGAGLLLRSAWRLEQVDPGFQPHGVTALRFFMGRPARLALRRHEMAIAFRRPAPGAGRGPAGRAPGGSRQPAAARRPQLQRHPGVGGHGGRASRPDPHRALPRDQRRLPRGDGDSADGRQRVPARSAGGRAAPRAGQPAAGPRPRRPGQGPGPPRDDAGHGRREGEGDHRRHRRRRPPSGLERRPVARDLLLLPPEAAAHLADVRGGAGGLGGGDRPAAPGGGEVHRCRPPHRGADDGRRSGSRPRPDPLPRLPAHPASRPRRSCWREWGSSASWPTPSAAVTGKWESAWPSERTAERSCRW